MKYANQINIAIAGIAFLVLLYVFSLTFWKTDSVDLIEFDSAEIPPEIMQTLGDGPPRMRNATTTSTQAISTPRGAGMRRSGSALPTWQPSNQTASPPATANTPTWNGPPISEALGSRDEAVQRSGSPRVNRQRDLTSVQSNRSSRGGSATVGVGGSPGPSGPSAPLGGSDAGPDGRARSFSPSQPPVSGAEDQKRGPDPNEPPPPVRSSMPASRPPN